MGIKFHKISILNFCKMLALCVRCMFFIMTPYITRSCSRQNPALHALSNQPFSCFHTLMNSVAVVMIVSLKQQMKTEIQKKVVQNKFLPLKSAVWNEENLLSWRWLRKIRDYN